jgi:copper chaperone CopZ
MNAYIHETPGRLRIKAAKVKRNAFEAERAQTFIEDLRGVDSVYINTLTGSVTVNFNPLRTNAEELLAALATEGYFPPDKREATDRRFEDFLADAGSKAARALLGVVVERALERTPLSFLSVLV